MNRNCRCDGEATKWRELGVVFNDLRVVGTGAGASLQSTMGSLFSPSSLLRKINAIRNPPLRDILSGFEGVIAPGEMLRESSVARTYTLSIHLVSCPRKAWFRLYYFP